METGRCRLDGKDFFCSGTQNGKEFLSQLYRVLEVDYPKFFKMDVLAKAGFLAAELLLQGAKEVGGERTGLFLANRSSSLDTDRHYQETIGEEYFPSPSVFVYTLPNIVLGEICIRHKIYGENTFFVSSEFEAERMCSYVERVFTETGMERALVGWLECVGDRCEVFACRVEKDGRGIDFTHYYINKLHKE